MKHLLLATAVLILAGCSDDDPATQLAACKMEAMKLWPNEDGILVNMVSQYTDPAERLGCTELHGGPWLSPKRPA